MKVKKPGYRKLWKLYQQQSANMKVYQDEAVRHRNIIAQLEKQLAARVDVAMMEQRVKLADSLGKMMDTVSEATRVIIGKEMF